MPSPFVWEGDEDQYDPETGSYRTMPKPAGRAVVSFSTPRRVMSESYDQLGGLGEQYDPETGSYRTMPSEPTPELPTPSGARLFDPEEGPRDEPGFSPGSKPRTALEDLSAHQGSMPQRQAPKWWQRLAAGALGGAAGYLNAGGRNRIDVDPAIEGIYNGGYNREMGNWQNEQAGLTTRAKIEAEQADDARKIAEHESTLALRGVQTKQAQAGIDREARLASGPVFPKDAQEAIFHIRQSGLPKEQQDAQVQQIVADHQALTAPKSQTGHWSEDGKGNVNFIPTPIDGKPAPGMVSYPGAGTPKTPPSKLLTPEELAQQILLRKTSSSAGADIVEPAVVADPASRDILSQTGLSVPAFYAITGQNSKLPRDAATRRNAMREAGDFARKNGVDMSVMASQYDALNKSLAANIVRLNNTKIMEGEVLGTIENLQSVVKDAELSRLNRANVIKIWAGQEVNDGLAQQYATHLQQLRNQMSAYLAATQGRSGNQLLDSDKKEADRVIRNGLAAGSLSGLTTAIVNETEKMASVLEKSVDRSTHGVWSLFGVGRNYRGRVDQNAGDPPPPDGAAPTKNYQQIKTDQNGQQWGWSPGMKEWQQIKSTK
jgi:hypothetical protein